MIIKIDRKTLRRNPNAGNTHTSVGCYEEISFKYTGTHKIFEELVSLEAVHLTSYLDDTSEGTITNVEAEGIISSIYNEDIFEKFRGKGLQIIRKIQRQEIRHFPEAEWIYRYTDPVLQCKKCNTTELLSNIPIVDLDDYHSIRECTVCQGHDTFGKIEYEQIGDIKQSLNKVKK